MKKTIGIAVFFMSSLAYAESYLPPAQIQCNVNDSDQLACQEFNRQFLTEDTADPSLQKNRDKTFLFYSATADGDSLIYTYKTLRFKWVTLKVVSSDIKPDLKNGQWKKMGKQLYVCEAGYAQCGMIK